jgi:CheY-like chemotaxis protein
MLFTVQDTGTGIPAHEVHRIFENFHRAHDQKGRSFEGTGMGLALTQELVKLHGGKMEVESTFGQGTIFTVFIPVGNSHLPQTQISVDNPLDAKRDDPIERIYGESIVEEAQRWGAREPLFDVEDTAPTPVDLGVTATASTASELSDVALQTHIWVPPSSRGCTILVADDNEDMRRFVKGVLSQSYEVLEASNGQIAFAIAMEHQPDLILSDIMMPGLDGFGLLKVLRSSPQARSIPFVLLSANAGETARVDGLVAGADDYLAKPFSPRELIARVHTLLDNARMRVELEKRVKEISKDLRESEERFRYVY